MKKRQIKADPKPKAVSGPRALVKAVLLGRQVGRETRDGPAMLGQMARCAWVRIGTKRACDIGDINRSSSSSINGINVIIICL